MKTLIKFAKFVITVFFLLVYVLLLLIVLADVFAANLWQRFWVVPVLLIPVLGLGIGVWNVFLRPNKPANFKINLLAGFSAMEAIFATISCGLHFEWWKFVIGSIWLVVAIAVQQRIRVREWWEHRL